MSKTKKSIIILTVLGLILLVGIVFIYIRNDKSKFFKNYTVEKLSDRNAYVTASMEDIVYGYFDFDYDKMSNYGEPFVYKNNVNILEKHFNTKNMKNFSAQFLSSDSSIMLYEYNLNGKWYITRFNTNTEQYKTIEVASDPTIEEVYEVLFVNFYQENNYAIYDLDLNLLFDSSKYDSVKLSSYVYDESHSYKGFIAKKNGKEFLIDLKGKKLSTEHDELFKEPTGYYFNRSNKNLLDLGYLQARDGNGINIYDFNGNKVLKEDVSTIGTDYVGYYKYFNSILVSKKQEDNKYDLYFYDMSGNLNKKMSITGEIFYVNYFVFDDTQVLVYRKSSTGSESMKYYYINDKYEEIDISNIYLSIYNPEGIGSVYTGWTIYKSDNFTAYPKGNEYSFSIKGKETDYTSDSLISYNNNLFMCYEFKNTYGCYVYDSNMKKIDNYSLELPWQLYDNKLYATYKNVPNEENILAINSKYNYTKVYNRNDSIKKYDVIDENGKVLATDALLVNHNRDYVFKTPEYYIMNGKFIDDDKFHNEEIKQLSQYDNRSYVVTEKGFYLLKIK